MAQKINDLDPAPSIVQTMQFETDIGGVTANKVTFPQVKEGIIPAVFVGDTSGVTDETQNLGNFLNAHGGTAFIPAGTYLISGLQRYVTTMPKLYCAHRGVKFRYRAYESVFDFNPPMAEVLSLSTPVVDIGEAGVGGIGDDGVNKSDYHTYVQLTSVTGYQTGKLFHISSRVGIPKEGTPNPITNITVDGGTNRVTVTFANAITASEYGNGAMLQFFNVTGTTQINNKTFMVADRDTTARTIVLKDTLGSYINGSTWGVFTGGGTWKKKRSTTTGTFFNIMKVPTKNFTVTAGTDVVAASSHGFTASGQGPVQVSSTGTLPAGLAASTNYWIIYIDGNNIKLATTYANALAGTAVDITDAGTGTHSYPNATIAYSDVAPTIGDEVFVDDVYGMLEINRRSLKVGTVTDSGVAASPSRYSFPLLFINADTSTSSLDSSAFTTFLKSGFGLSSENWAGESGLISNVDPVLNRIYLVNPLMYRDLYTTESEFSQYNETHKGGIYGFPTAIPIEDADDPSIRYAPAAFEIRGVPRVELELFGDNCYGPTSRTRSCPLAQVTSGLANAANRARANIPTSIRSITTITNASQAVFTLASAPSTVMMSEYDNGKLGTIRIAESSPKLSERSFAIERVSSTQVKPKDLKTGAYINTTDTTVYGIYTSGDASLYMNNTERKVNATQAFTANSSTDALTVTAHKFTASPGVAQGPIILQQATQTFTVDAGTDIITAAAHGYAASGDGSVTIASSGSLPGGLAAATPYWIIYIDANTFKLATSKANAISGTAIDITTAGSGTLTMTKLLPTGLAINTAYWVIYVDVDNIKLATSAANAIAGTAIDITDIGSPTNTIAGLYKKTFDTTNNVIYFGSAAHGLSTSNYYYIHCDPASPYASLLNNKVVFPDTDVTAIANAITGSGNYSATTAVRFRTSEGNIFTLPAGYTGDLWISATDNSGSLTYAHSLHGPEFGAYVVLLYSSYCRHGGGTTDGSNIAYATNTRHQRGVPTYFTFVPRLMIGVQGPAGLENHEEGLNGFTFDAFVIGPQKGDKGATYDGYGGQNRSALHTLKGFMQEGGTYGLRQTGQFHHHMRPVSYWENFEIRNLRHPTGEDTGMIFDRTDSTPLYHRPITKLYGNGTLRTINKMFKIGTGQVIRAEGLDLLVEDVGYRVFEYKSRHSGMADFGKVTVDYRGNKNPGQAKALAMVDSDNCWLTIQDLHLILRDDDLHATGGSLLDISLTGQKRFNLGIRRLRITNPSGRTIPRLCDAADYPFINFDSYGPDLLDLTIGDDVTPLASTGVKFRRLMARPFMPTRYILSASVAPTTTVPVVDLKKNGTTLFGTNKLKIDLGELSSITAADQLTIIDASLTPFLPEDVISADVTAFDVAATGLRVYVQGYYLN